jgi:hypothetical protein
MDRTLTATRDDFPRLSEAVDRHMRWLLDFARFGDVESAVVAIADVHALCSELDDSHVE